MAYQYDQQVVIMVYTSYLYGGERVVVMNVMYKYG